MAAKASNPGYSGLVVLCFLSCPAIGRAQRSIGSVAPADATVAGALEISNGRIELVGASTVTARDHTAEVKLQRGGAIRVCSTSGLHVATGKGAVEAPLMLALDRGAIEIATRVTASDVVMTPDLRFTMGSPGALDLRLRVARNGDTCVENRGATAPSLNVADQFGESSYMVKPGQHVLFEHGSLKEVVDQESEPCGCPAAPVISVANAGVSGTDAAAPGSAVAKTAAEQHPFPAAQSAGLAPLSGPPQTPAGTVHAQVATTLSYGGEAGGGSATTGDNETTAAGQTVASSKTPGPHVEKASETPAESAPKIEVAGKAQAPPPPAAPPPSDLFHSIGRFFKHLFGRH
ncbi:nuclease [Edaphobacter sp. 12200R-103]|uniref:nuclease n=1 Tax=Edaphobacter sp. 12200R-103 TaxID=2703788 RepID=UPI00138BFA42|nr:nuclease [Edaphobacter sp. 12200R-103]QHS52171.1 nuclease [Edaphobacter sp. 12200R-103]